MIPQNFQCKPIFIEIRSVVSQMNDEDGQWNFSFVFILYASCMEHIKTLTFRLVLFHTME
jgi:hypothetical protein